jgi:hypothetical protein
LFHGKVLIVKYGELLGRGKTVGVLINKEKFLSKKKQISLEPV